MRALHGEDFWIHVASKGPVSGFYTGGKPPSPPHFNCLFCGREWSLCAIVYSSQVQQDLCCMKFSLRVCLSQELRGLSNEILIGMIVQVEDQSQPFYARATMDRECPYDPTALSFRVSHIYPLAVCTGVGWFCLHCYNQYIRTLEASI